MSCSHYQEAVIYDSLEFTVQEKEAVYSAIYGEKPVKTRRYHFTGIRRFDFSSHTEEQLEIALHAVKSFEAGRFEEALNLFNNLSKYDNIRAQSCNNAGIALESMKRQGEAIDMYLKASMDRPDSDIYRKNFLACMAGGV